MADEPTKRKVTILIRRERRDTHKIIVATGFKLRPDKATGLLDVYLQTSGQNGERVSFDPFVMRSNQEDLKRFVASLSAEQDDTAQKEEIPVSQEVNFANIVNFARVGERAETVFGIYSLSDWAEATRQTTSGPREIKSIDTVVVISTLGFQKKLLLELLLTLSPQT